MVRPANGEIVFVIKLMTRGEDPSWCHFIPMHLLKVFTDAVCLVWVVLINDFVISFLQPYCSLHLHLHVSANPYTSGNIASRDSAPGIIVASGGCEGVCLSDMLFPLSSWNSELFPLSFYYRIKIELRPLQKASETLRKINREYEINSKLYPF